MPATALVLHCRCTADHTWSVLMPRQWTSAVALRCPTCNQPLADLKGENDELAAGAAMRAR